VLSNPFFVQKAAYYVPQRILAESALYQHVWPLAWPHKCTCVCCEMATNRINKNTWKNWVALQRPLSVIVVTHWKTFHL